MSGEVVEAIHHVSVPVRDLDRSRRFYREVLGLQEIERPPFEFPGAWFAAGDSGNQVHLIVDEESTFRDSKGVASRDIHFALRVQNFREALRLLESKGYSEGAAELDLLKLKVSPHSTAGFPQLYLLDPDRNIIEINAERLDPDSPG